MKLTYVNNYLINVALIVTSSLIVSCSTTHNPAPVIEINTNKVIKKYIPIINSNPIKTTNYTVKKGETLFSISWRIGINFKELANINNIESPYVIYPGQQLTLQQKKQKNVKEKLKKSTNSKQLEKNEKKFTKPLAQKKQPAYVQNKPKVSTTPPRLEKKYPNKVKVWNWPITGNMRQKIDSYFSTNSTGNNGIKIRGERGEQIHAAADGRVVYAGNALRGYGNLIIIKHNDDYLSAYAHCEKILVQEKTDIKQGQVIAQMGDTDSNKVQLHFEIRFRGKSVDPLKYLPKI